MIWTRIAVIGLFYVVCIVYTAIQCVPRHGEAGWLSMAAQARCAQPKLDLSAAQGIFSSVSDMYVLFIPMHLVFNLRMPISRRIGVSAIFLTGAM
jgi:hypothetical protein